MPGSSIVQLFFYNFLVSSSYVSIGNVTNHVPKTIYLIILNNSLSCPFCFPLTKNLRSQNYILFFVSRTKQSHKI
jgi:hypothetical protein